MDSIIIYLEIIWIGAIREWFVYQKSLFKPYICVCMDMALNEKPGNYTEECYK